MTVDRIALEALLSPDEAKAFVQQRYDETGKLPGRRFRVEDSRVGTSRFVGKAEAERTMSLYGGRIVEYRPTMKRQQPVRDKGGSHGSW